MFLRLWKIEVIRLVLRGRFIASFGALALIGLGLMFFSTGGTYQAPDASGAWTAWSAVLELAVRIFLLAPVFVGFVVGNSLAEDRATGYLNFMAARVERKSVLVAAKCLGITTAAFIGGIGVMALFVLSAFFIYPSSPFDPSVASFNKELFSACPFLYLTAIAIMAGLSMAAMAGVATFASIWFRNPYVVGAMPIGYMFLSILLPKIDLWKYLSLSGTYLSFSSITAYWTAHLLMALGGTIILSPESSFRRKITTIFGRSK